MMARAWSLLSLGASLLFSPALFAEEKPSLWDRLLYGGELTATYSGDDTGYFNETEYRRNGLRLFRVSFALEFQASEKVSLLTEIRSDNLDRPQPYALYVRLHPWSEHAFDVQVGRIPPVFGAFSRRRYDYDNPLIGYPLAYQYPSVLRADNAPAEVTELLEQRGYGARVLYPLGDRTPMAGLPLSNPLRWDTGVSVRAGREPLELAAAVTQGTISNPRVRDDNSGKQVAARLGWRPIFGAAFGFSAARGEYVADAVQDLSPARGEGRSSHQTSFGLDAELSRDHWLVRAETIFSRWDAPTISIGSLDALGFMLEGRYKILPGLFAAGRLDRLSYFEIEGPEGRTSWDAPVTRVEFGVGYNLHRHLLAKVSFQYNERDDAAGTSLGIPAVQILFWF